MKDVKRGKQYKNVLFPVAVFVLIWITWSIWQNVLLPKLRLSSIITLLIDCVAVKGVLWAFIPFMLLKRNNCTIVPLNKKLFFSKIPWLPCLIAVCLSAVFLHTLRLLNGLMNTHVFFSLEMVLMSVSAGVFEEIGFRGCFFNTMDEPLGFLPAASVNGLMFVLFHFPSLIFGDFSGFISLRTLMIFMVGAAFCWLFKRWKSLTMLIVIHLTWDILSYLFCLF